MYAKVTLLSPPFSTLTYSLPKAFPQDFWRPGLRVVVPLGKNPNSRRAGYMEETGVEPPAGVDCRELCFPLETSPIINQELMAIARELALRHGLNPGAPLGHILPAPLRSATSKLRTWANNQARELNFAHISSLPPRDFAALANSFLAGQARFVEKGDDPAARELCMLKTDPPWPLRPGARRQLEVLEFLHVNGTTNRRRLLKNLGSGSASALSALVAAGYVGIGNTDDLDAIPAMGHPGREQSFELNQEQKEALASLSGALCDPAGQCRLLYGVTGSGKTAIYQELARICPQMDRSIFILAPEVALAIKLRQEMARIIPPDMLVFYHGYQQPATRANTFRTISRHPKPSVVIGTRSALFLPVYKPGCVILDEEHDNSFKQDENFPYHAREIGWFRMEHNRGLLVLGSATPDIRTFYASKSGALPLARLSARVGGGELPPVELVDIGPAGGHLGGIASESAGLSILAPRVEEALSECVQKGEQAVILLNRRGYAPMVYCVPCGKSLRCPNCAIGLAFHKNRQKLLCHYCGYSVPYPSPCPECGNSNFLPMGEGTERLAERLEFMAGGPVPRLDRDNVRRPGKMEEILADFAAGKSPFLVGTQMLSKGHHFPNVTLVVVADGDIGLNLPDYHAAERTFQLLVQSAGRAGRGDKPGKVLIQTREPGNPFWRFVVNYDYEGFYAAELAKRQKYLYPPFGKLALLRISFPVSEQDGRTRVYELGTALKSRATAMGVRLLGPAPAPIAMLKGRMRFHCLIKASEWPEARELYFYAQRLKASRILRLFLDIDPVNML